MTTPDADPNPGPAGSGALRPASGWIAGFLSSCWPPGGGGNAGGPYNEWDHRQPRHPGTGSPLRPAVRSSAAPSDSAMPIGRLGRLRRRVVRADADSSFQSVSSGWIHTCGVKEDGAPACRGRDGFDKPTLAPPAPYPEESPSTKAPTKEGHPQWTSPPFPPRILSGEKRSSRRRRAMWRWTSTRPALGLAGIVTSPCARWAGRFR